ncbi:hypothetical protein PCYB_003330 [Plasmodium cynomolgi strain B]|uniref:Uncharacterized protein n=1 Tax=Plasmodium cynomolgi (strain B) TaxID=1120755 RepID=K6V002_PLACD|nr:hypothetical protein PCYB_003330 [Plasmodium cynomolgi strain B]GAB69584.1 hypothetical protein PCYB_003330 [Plasmodium cynomolgi strain B]
MVLEVGAGSGLASILFFTYANIFRNELMKDQRFGHLDSSRSKVKICNVDWTNENTYPCENKQIVTYDYIIGSDFIYDKKIFPKNRDVSQEFFDELKNGNYDIQLFTPPSYYFISPFLNLSQNLYEAKFSEFTDASNIVMMRFQKY